MIKIRNVGIALNDTNEAINFAFRLLPKIPLRRSTNTFMIFLKIRNIRRSKITMLKFTRPKKKILLPFGFCFEFYNNVIKKNFNKTKIKHKINTTMISRFRFRISFDTAPAIWDGSNSRPFKLSYREESSEFVFLFSSAINYFFLFSDLPKPIISITVCAASRPL